MLRAGSATTAWIMALVLTSGLSRAANPPTATATPAAQPLVWTDVDGRGYGPIQLKANAATVFIAFSTRCPVSNAYMGRVRSLEQTYFNQRVRFFLFDSSPLDSPEMMRRYAQDRHLAAPLIRDADGDLVDRLGARVTSEAIVLDRAGLVRYRGRIDDNKDADLVHHRYLAGALDTLLAGGTIARPWPRAEGCFIDRVTLPKVAVKSGAVLLTYARDVAPILNRQCVNCHRDGEVAPFSLSTYRDARIWARQIKDATQRHIIPPWKAEPGYGDFDNSSALTARERSILAHWADCGAPAGNLKAAPKPPTFAGDWPLGNPDLVVRPKGAYHLAADGRDVYRCFVLPLEIKQNAYLDFCQFKPANRAVVHHIILYVDPTGRSAEMAASDAEGSFESLKAGAGPPVPGAYMVDGWAPGNSPTRSPEGFAALVPKGSRLIMEVHYHRSGRPEVDQSALGLTFAHGTITKLWNGGEVIQPFLALEPGNPHIVVSANTVLDQDVTLYNVAPHMHQIGKEMRVWAVTPDQHRNELIWLKDWDFNWQISYNYRNPVRLPKGTRIEMTAVFDNSENNPRNPNRPPKRITWGEQTTDEMCIAFLGWTVDAQHLSLPAPRWEDCVEMKSSEGTTAASVSANR